MFIKGSLKRVLALFLTVTILATMMVIVCISVIYIKTTGTNIEQANQLIVSELQQSISDEITVIRKALSTLANKEEIKEYVGKGSGYRVTEVKNVQSLLNDIPEYVTCITDIIITTSDGHVLSTNNNSEINSYLSRYNLSVECSNHYYPALRIISLNPQNENDYLAAFAMSVRTTGNRGNIIAFCNVKQALSRIFENSTDFAVLDEDEGNAIFSSAPDSLSYDEDHADWTSFPVKEMNWRILMRSPLQETNVFENSLMQWSIWLILVVIVIECICMFCIYRAIVAPVSMICTQAENVQDKLIHIDNPAPKRREITALTDSINGIVMRTKQLTEEVNKTQMEMLEIKISALRSRNMFLQAQINPHFLYNMLECICGMASESGNTSIREMTHLMSVLYRYCLKSPQSTLGEEVDSVMVYSQIISYRYEKPHQIICRIPDSLRSIPMPCMILEPLVENSIQHGFNHNSDTSKRVIVNGSFENQILHLTIYDNGCGMPQERIDWINAQIEHMDKDWESDEARIGLLNVAHRLQLTYGSESCFVLERNTEGGLTVNIHLHITEQIMKHM